MYSLILYMKGSCKRKNPMNSKKPPKPQEKTGDVFCFCHLRFCLFFSWVACDNGSPKSDTFVFPKIGENGPWAVTCSVTHDKGTSKRSPPSAGHSLSFWVFSTCTAGMAQQLMNSPPSHGSLWVGGFAWAEAGVKSGSMKLDSRSVQLCRLQEGSNFQERGRACSWGQ